MSEMIENKISLSRENVEVEKTLPIKIVQFGEGNFLRAFVEYAFQQLNEKADFNGGIGVVQPIERGMVDTLDQQDGLYTLFLKGIEKGQEIQSKELITNVVKCINPYKDFERYLKLSEEDSLEFVISNTTEAGIAYMEGDTKEMSPPDSFPAKLTLFLYHRFNHFKGNPNKGLTIIPCELINHNADTLFNIIDKYIEDWHLEDSFKQWVHNSCTFHNTLVDRIVPGYPKEEIEQYNSQLHYQDKLIVAAEVFFLWVIEGDENLKNKLPFHKTELDVKIVQDMQPYRTRKVRILNGAHTTMVPFSILYGNQTVKETVDNQFTGNFVHHAIFEEINPTLPMQKEELEAFSNDVLDRFRNPFIKHQLSDIALNSISKFKVRVLPSLLAYVNMNKKLPVHLTFAFACLIRFYKGSWQNKSLPVKDSDSIKKVFSEIWKQDDYNLITKEVLGQVEFWDQNLNEINGLTIAIASALQDIENHGIELGFEKFSRTVKSF